MNEVWSSFIWISFMSYMKYQINFPWNYLISYNINKQLGKNRNKNIWMTGKVVCLIMHNLWGKSLKMIYYKVLHVYWHISSVLGFVAIIELYLCVQLHLFIQLADGMQPETLLLIAKGWKEDWFCEILCTASSCLSFPSGLWGCFYA